MTTTVHFTTGLPGSGKTTCARQLVAEAGGKLKRFNLDDIRAMTANGVYSKENETLALKVLDKGVLAAVQQGFNVILDNTHLHKRVPERILTTLATEDVDYRVHSFLDVPVEECIRRDAERGQRGERYVGPDVIERMARKQRWTLREDWLNAQALNASYYIPDTFQPRAVIVDLDGTLAIHKGRSPYDTARCGEDLLNTPLNNVLRGLAQTGHQIILMSGRSDEFRPHTEDWLWDHQVLYHALFMREEGDRRRDDRVKLELFDRHVRNPYNVTMAFDDRDRVVNLWRSIGIMTAQMGPGDF
ncbi:AAA family ATPase [Streptomyces sp. NPDC005551]|uniref:phosphatase domain-containing protein n=1 Tax=Streptomyces sp. NPDC005551 TaxID=3364725 RepID=UPI00368B983A